MSYPLRLQWWPRLALVAVAGLLAAPRPAAGDAAGSWTQLPGPPAGAINSLAIDPLHPEVLYAGSGLAGAFKSVDGGGHWVAANHGLSGGPVTFVAVDPRDESVWAAVNDATGIGNGFRSQDGGASWQKLPAGSPVNALLLSLAFDPRSPAVVYAGTITGFFRTTDGGATWQTGGAGLPSGFNVSAVAVDPGSGAVFAGLAGAAGGLFKSLDGGVRWKTINPAPGLVDGVQGIVIVPGPPAAVYADAVTGVFRSDDGGATWKPASRGLRGLRDGRRAVVSLAADGGDPSTLYALTVSQAGESAVVFRSDDRGDSWSAVASPAGALILAGLVAVPGSARALFAFGSSGVVKSVDGGASLQPADSGLTAPGVESIAVDPASSSTLFAVTSESNLFRSRDGGVSWGLRVQTATGAIALDPRHPAIVYAGVEGGILKSDDGGDTWKSLAGAPCVLPQAIVIDPADTSNLYLVAKGDRSCATRAGIFRSSDGGRTFSALSGLGGPVSQLAVDLADTAILYALSSGTLLRSADQGATWKPAASGLAGAAPFQLAASPAAPGNLYLSTGDGRVFRSTDRARHWQLQSAGPVRGSALFLAADPVRSGVLYAFGGHAFFRSLDGGATWSFLGAGLGQAQLSGALAIAPQEPGVLYAGTSDLGLWRLRLPAP
jgi:photosystem II stability/assembly factor-like uncharacterized protein